MGQVAALEDKVRLENLCVRKFEPQCTAAYVHAFVGKLLGIDEDKLRLPEVRATVELWTPERAQLPF